MAGSVVAQPFAHPWVGPFLEWIGRALSAVGHPGIRVLCGTYGGRITFVPFPIGLGLGLAFAMVKREALVG